MGEVSKNMIEGTTKGEPRKDYAILP